MRNLYLILIGTILLTACNSDETRETKEFPRHITLTANKKKIDQVIKPVNMAIHGDFLIIQNDRIPDSHCFYVYSLESLDFLYSFGSFGESEDEYLAPRISRSVGNEHFAIFDQRTRNINLYNITNESAELVERKNMNEPTKFPLQELSFVNDSVLLYLSVDNKVVSYNLNQESIVDTIQFDTGIESYLGGEYSQSMDFFHFANYGNRIVTGHNFINRITANQSDDRGLFQTNVVSMTKERPNNFNSSLYDNMYHYIYVYASADNVFAQYSGYKFKTLQPFPMNMGKRHFDFLMEVYDWDLKPKALLEFDNNIMTCIIDEERKRIITWDPLEDLNYLLVYDYDL